MSGEDPFYPREAIRAGVDKGRVLARVHIDEKGNVTDVVIVSAEPPRHFDHAVREALMKWKFKAEGEKYVGEVEVNFTLKDELQRDVMALKSWQNGRRPSCADSRRRRPPHTQRSIRTRKGRPRAAFAFQRGRVLSRRAASTPLPPHVAAPSARMPTPICGSAAGCTISRNASWATSANASGNAHCADRRGHGPHRCDAGLRQAGAATGAGSACMTRAVKPSSGT